MADEIAHRIPELDRSTWLAFDRTRVAYERTMLAWVRTATSLITFGFSVYKLFQIVREEDRAQHLIGARQFGFVLVSIGLASLALATIEYRQNIRSLEAQYERKSRSLAVIVAGLVSILGIFAIGLMIFRG